MSELAQNANTNVMANYKNPITLFSICKVLSMLSCDFPFAEQKIQQYTFADAEELIEETKANER